MSVILLIYPGGRCDKRYTKIHINNLFDDCHLRTMSDAVALKRCQFFWFDDLIVCGEDLIFTRAAQNGKALLPQTFFIKNGEVVFSHDGVCKSLEDASSEMTDEMKEEVRNIIRKGFDKMR